MGKKKDVECRIAYVYYVEKYKTAKESAALAGVSEKTVNDWVVKFGWKTQRDARLNSTSNRIGQIKELIGLLTQRRLDLEQRISKLEKAGKDKEDIEELREQTIRIGDDVSKWNKTLENIDKEGRINLGVYIEIMDDIFTSMQVESPELYLQTIDFQQKHLQVISLKYG